MWNIAVGWCCCCWCHFPSDRKTRTWCASPTTRTIAVTTSTRGSAWTCCGSWPTSWSSPSGSSWWTTGCTAPRSPTAAGPAWWASSSTEWVDSNLLTHLQANLVFVSCFVIKRRLLNHVYVDQSIRFGGFCCGFCSFCLSVAFWPTDRIVSERNLLERVAVVCGNEARSSFSCVELQPTST